MADKSWFEYRARYQIMRDALAVLGVPMRWMDRRDSIKIYSNELLARKEAALVAAENPIYRGIYGALVKAEASSTAPDPIWFSVAVPIAAFKYEDM